MGMDSAKVAEAINQVVGKDKMDEGTVDYMAGMIAEENVSSASSCAELVGPFLIDAGVAGDDNDALKICEKLIAKLSLLNESVKAADGSPKETNGDLKLKKPVVLSELVKQNSGNGFHDPFLGIKQMNVNFNSDVPLSDVLKNQKALQRERDRNQKLMQEWEKAKMPLPPPKRKHGDCQLAKVTDIIVNSFSVAIAGRELLADAPLRLVVGHKYGLNGRNGIGKSTLLSALARYEIHGVPHDTHILHIEQEIKAGSESALESVVSVDLERKELLEEAANIEKKKPPTDAEGKRLTWIHQRLVDIDSHAAETKAAEILAGLGFTPEMQKTSTKNFSGGWRMRVALARALFADPDLLLLDEPTNHLDLHAVAWLTKYLQNWDKTCIIVSHARQFLNEVCTDIIHFADKTLMYYKGDYDTFEGVRAERHKMEQRQFEAQQAKRDHMQKFIDRFRYNANRAALVQSRIKALNKLPMLDEIKSDPTLVFTFEEPEELPTPMLQLEDVYFKWSEEAPDWLLKGVNINVDMDSRIAVCGVNGSGKSSLLHVLLGHNKPSKGHLTRHNKLRIGYFSQHHVDTMDLTLNAVQQLQTRYPEANLKVEDARTYLGKFGISGMLALEPVYVLSGGQKSRVAIALMAFKNPHILVLDEPTNHLDLEAVQALICALNDFKGGVVVVSHDSHMISCVCDEVWHVDAVKHTATKYPGDFDLYRKNVLRGKTT